MESGARAATVEARQAAVAPMASTTGLSGKSKLHFAAARYLSKQASSRANLPFRASLNNEGRILNSCRNTAFSWLRAVAGFIGVLMKANKRDAVRLLNSATRNVRRQLRAAYVDAQSYSGAHARAPSVVQRVVQCAATVFPRVETVFVKARPLRKKRRARTAMLRARRLSAARRRPKKLSVAFAPQTSAPVPAAPMVPLTT
mmetsp:Transcript_12770/g.38041  ORF Transcript_12770/g.38041 Transcript_12770/m.38041 type:complete len:201 (-) Transcript_12770:244-846(-)